MLTLGQPFYSGYGVTVDVDSFREIRDGRARGAALPPRPRADPALPRRGDARAATRASRCSSTTRRRTRARSPASLDAAVRERARRGRRLTRVVRVAFERDRPRARRGRARRARRATCAPRWPRATTSSCCRSPSRRAGAGASPAGWSASCVWFPWRAAARGRARCGADLLHCPMPLGAAARARRCRRSWRSTTRWPGTTRSGSPARTRSTRARRSRRALRRAAAVLVPSAHTRDRAAGARRAGCRRGRASRPGASPPRFSPGPGPVDDRGPYLLAVGHAAAAQEPRGRAGAFERLHADGLEHRLVVAGARGWRDERAGRAAARLARRGADRARGPGRRRRARGALPRRRVPALPLARTRASASRRWRRWRAARRSSPPRRAACPRCSATRRRSWTPDDRRRPRRRGRARARRPGAVAGARPRVRGAVHVGALRGGDGGGLPRGAHARCASTLTTAPVGSRMKQR